MAWGALDRASKVGHVHLLGSAGLVQVAPVAEVALRSGATKSPVLGFARVDAQLKVDRAPIRAPRPTKVDVAVKARRAFDKAAKQAAREGGGCPPAGIPGLGSGAGPLTPAAPAAGSWGGGRRAEWRS